MTIATLPHLLKSARATAGPGMVLPPQVNLLAPREREVAAIVYRAGLCTAKQVQAQLSSPITSGAARSMLVRLVKKGLLVRHWGRRGRGHEYVYGPALDPDHAKRRAVEEIAEAFFGGSLAALAKEISLAGVAFPENSSGADWAMTWERD